MKIIKAFNGKNKYIYTPTQLAVLILMDLIQKKKIHFTDQLNKDVKLSGVKNKETGEIKMFSFELIPKKKKNKKPPKGFEFDLN